jgi:eukaryotic-like serine/threonine-protein kinase
MQEKTTLRVEMVIRGQYVIENLLGRSGSGATYLVRDQHDRDASSSLFVLKEVVEADKQARHRLVSVGKFLRRLHHPGLPRVHRVLNDDKNKRVYLLIDYIAGQNLETLRQQQPENLFAWTEVMHIMAPINAALTYLHHQQPPIIHGDIKPANILKAREDSRVVLVDFSMIKVYDPGSTTAADQYCYRPPEQYNGSINVRTDIYAMGATFYTLVTGKPPPDATSRLTQVSNKARDPLEPVNSIVPAIPMHIGKTIERAMSLNAQHRFSSVEQFWEALWLILAEHPAPVIDKPSVPTPGPERAIGQSIEKPVPEPLPVVPVTVSIEEREDREIEQLPSVVPIPRSVEEREDSDAEKLLPMLPPVVPAGVNEQKGLNVVNLLPKPSGHVRTPISLRKLGVLIIVLALLISLGTGANFLSRAQSHPATYSAHPASHAASSASRPTSAPVASSYSTLAGTYTGTIYGISANVTTKMSLTGIQQTQIGISGNFTGLHKTGTFNGIIDPHPPKHIQFTVKDSAGHLVLSFDGNMQSDGELSGNYCTLNPAGQCVGEYGLWSVAPAS